MKVLKFFTFALAAAANANVKNFDTFIFLIKFK